MPSTPITWSGAHEFLVVGTDRHEDTLRVRCLDPKQEGQVRVVLPTLCITYADMAFAAAVGGAQAPYPDSDGYGPAFFDPPVEITPEAEVERLTWIRGADRVVIGPKETVVEFSPRRTLVIPRFRVRTDKPAALRLEIDHAVIREQEEFVVDVSQLADGRPIGGISLRKRHPDYTPPEDKERPWTLWVQVLDGASGRPLPKVRLRWLRRAAGAGGPVLVAEPTTDEHGVVAADGQPPGAKETLVLDDPRWLPAERSFRPLPGQPVRLRIHARSVAEDAGGEPGAATSP